MNSLSLVSLAFVVACVAAVPEDGTPLVLPGALKNLDKPDVKKCLKEAAKKFVKCLLFGDYELDEEPQVSEDTKSGYQKHIHVKIVKCLVKVAIEFLTCLI